MNEQIRPSSSPLIKVRQMYRTDLDAVLDIDAQITGRRRSTSWSENVADYLSGGLSSGCRVAEVDGNVVGFLLGDVRGFEYGLPKGGWIDVMGVSPAYQRRGLGSRLVASFRDHCRKLGVEKVYLLATRGDEGIESFFAALGFGESPLAVFEQEVR